MLEFRIEVINKKFEDTKEEVNNGKLLVYAKWEVEDLLEEANELKLLMAQWSHTHEMPNIAGSYMTGREMENAYRQVINNLVNAREVLYEYAHKINNEIDRKRSEFNLPLRGE